MLCHASVLCTRTRMLEQLDRGTHENLSQRGRKGSLRALAPPSRKASALRAQTTNSRRIIESSSASRALSSISAYRRSVLAKSAFGSTAGALASTAVDFDDPKPLLAGFLLLLLLLPLLFAPTFVAAIQGLTKVLLRLCEGQVCEGRLRKESTTAGASSPKQNT